MTEHSECKILVDLVIFARWIQDAIGTSKRAVTPGNELNSGVAKSFKIIEAEFGNASSSFGEVVKRNDR